MPLSQNSIKSAPSPTLFNVPWPYPTWNISHFLILQSFLNSQTDVCDKLALTSERFC